MYIVLTALNFRLLLVSSEIKANDLALKLRKLPFRAYQDSTNESCTIDPTLLWNLI